jgi:hypothetical protein
MPLCGSVLNTVDTTRWGELFSPRGILPASVQKEELMPFSLRDFVKTCVLGAVAAGCPILVAFFATRVGFHERRSLGILISQARARQIARDNARGHFRQIRRSVTKQQGRYAVGHRVLRFRS